MRVVFVVADVLAMEGAVQAHYFEENMQPIQRRVIAVNNFGSNAAEHVEILPFGNLAVTSSQPPSDDPVLN